MRPSKRFSATSHTRTRAHHHRIQNRQGKESEKKAKSEMRKQPNILVTGTPGVGKSTHCTQIAEQTGLKHLDVNAVAKEHDCYDGYDEELKSHILDEDKVCVFLRITFSDLALYSLSLSLSTSISFCVNFFFVGAHLLTAFPPPYSGGKLKIAS
jgi:hypothetical protein